MTRSKLISAATAGGIALATALIALLTDARSFDDISDPAYAVAGLGAAVTFLKDLQSSNRSPDA